MYDLDEQLAQQLHRERLQRAEQERLVRAARRGQPRAGRDEPPTFRLWYPGRWFARRPAIPGR